MPEGSEKLEWLTELWSDAARRCLDLEPFGRTTFDEWLVMARAGDEAALRSICTAFMPVSISLALVADLPGDVLERIQQMNAVLLEVALDPSQPSVLIALANTADES